MQNERTGLILNYRTGNKAENPKMYLIKVLGANPSESCQMIGWRLGWPADDPKIHGKIVGPHGKKGILKARFRKGLPGKALATQIKIDRITRRSLVLNYPSSTNTTSSHRNSLIDEYIQ